MPAGVQRGFSRAMILNDPTSTHHGLGADLGDGKGRCLFEGSWNADIYPPLKATVQQGDIFCAKNRMSGLWSPDQDLWQVLSGERGEGRKETLLFAGVNTDQCVLGTLTDAYNAGWDCVMVEDCCATTTEWGREVCLHNIASSYGFVVDSGSFCAGEVGKKP
jgi:nicotinamidase-related amidase